jgi:hypothetical protein
MIESSRRAELFKEYETVIGILQMYDSYFLTIKNWGVTVGGAAVAVGATKGSTDIFLVGTVIALGFWVTEARFKLLQLGHTRRAAELERALQANEEVLHPRILGAFGEESARNIAMSRWRSVMRWPQVMFPHVVVVVVSLGAALWSVGVRFRGAAP